jgi:hypothetical protein
MRTEVIATAEFKEWFNLLSEEEQASIIPVVDLLEEKGVSLKGIYTSAILGSKLPLRELRVQHMGKPYRILYIFDPKRQAVLLVGGNKTGKGNRWYGPAIAAAEKSYVKYLTEIEA